MSGFHTGKIFFVVFSYSFSSSSSFFFSSSHSSLTNFFFLPFSNSSILHISPFSCLPSSLSSKKISTLPARFLWLLHTKFFAYCWKRQFCGFRSSDSFGGHILVFVLGFALTVRCAFLSIFFFFKFQIMGSYFKPWWERKMAAFLMNLGLTWRIWLETEDLIECFVWFLWISLVWFPFFIVMFFLLWALIHLFTTVSKLCLAVGIACHFKGSNSRFWVLNALSMHYLQMNLEL